MTLSANEAGNPRTIKEVAVDFQQDSWVIDPAYSGNSAKLQSLRQLLRELGEEGLLSLDSLYITGYASPEGPDAKNRMLAHRRALSLRDYLRDNCGVADSLLSVREIIIPWDDFRHYISSSTYPWRDEALKILRAGSDGVEADGLARILRLKRLAKGQAWESLRQDVLPLMRKGVVVIDMTALPEQAQTAQEVESVESEDVAAVVAPIAEEVEMPKRERNYDRFAIKTNVLYLAAGVANIGGEMAVSPHWSIDLPVVCSPYTIASDYRLRLFYLQPEARYWLDKPLKGHFFGAHLTGGVANVSFDRNTRYQTPHGLWGAGISYGYTLPIASRWSIEFTIGAGYFFTKYDKYYNIGVPIGKRYSRDNPFNYWGIDKLGINIVYRFGDKSGRGGAKL